MEEANGLCLMELGSEVKPVMGLNGDNEEALLAIVAETFSEKAYVVAWLHHALRIGTWQAGGFHFHDGPGLPFKHIIKLRVFDHDAELLIWMAHAGLKGRLRRDDRQGSGTQVVAARQVLFGTRSVGHPFTGYTTITEDRGTTLFLPFNDVNLKEKDKRNRICICTHNYVDYNKIGQATYADCRFVRFCDITGAMESL